MEALAQRSVAVLRGRVQEGDTHSQLLIVFMHNIKITKNLGGP